MSIAVENNPPNYVSAHGQLLFLVSSDNVTEPNFKYVFEIEIAGVVIATAKRWPYPSNNLGLFDAAPIVRSYLNNQYFASGSVAIVTEIDIDNFFEKTVRVRFGEEYGTPVTTYTNLEQYDLDAWNYVNEINDANQVPFFDADQLTEYQGDYLTNMPDVVSANLNENLYVSWFFADTPPAYVGAPCVMVALAEGYSFDDVPDANTDDDYDYSIPLTGSTPITVSPTDIPSWMTAEIIEVEGVQVLHLFGSPAFGDIDTGITVSVTLTNCGGDLPLSTTIDVTEGGRNVFLINDTPNELKVVNSNGHEFTFASSASGNIIMPTDTLTVSEITGPGTHTVDFLQTMPSTIINSTTVIMGGTVTTDDLSITNYVRFNS